MNNDLDESALDLANRCIASLCATVVHLTRFTDEVISELGDIPVSCLAHQSVLEYSLIESNGLVEKFNEIYGGVNGED